jgi:hypothetical protein
LFFCSSSIASFGSGAKSDSMASLALSQPGF